MLMYVVLYAPRTQESAGVLLSGKVAKITADLVTLCRKKPPATRKPFAIANTALRFPVRLTTDSALLLSTPVSASNASLLQAPTASHCHGFTIYYHEVLNL